MFFAGDNVIARMAGRHHADASRPDVDDETSSPALPIVLGTVLDGVPESAVLGLTLLETGSWVSMLVECSCPTSPNRRRHDRSPPRGLDQAAARAPLERIAVVAALAAGLGFALLDGGERRRIHASFAGGAILTMLSTSMIPEAYEIAGRPVGLVVTLGFAVAYGIDWLAG